MKLNIKELGYVKQVNVNLNKDLIILCGPNNTGKTYVAYTLYGLMKFRSRLIPLIPMGLLGPAGAFEQKFTVLICYLSFLLS